MRIVRTDRVHFDVSSCNEEANIVFFFVWQFGKALFVLKEVSVFVKGYKAEGQLLVNYSLKILKMNKKKRGFHSVNDEYDWMFSKMH